MKNETSTESDDWYPRGTTIDGHEFRGGGMCPEQYHVFKDGVQVSYTRLRHGLFLVKVPDAGGMIVYAASPRGDGCFENDEREHYLRKAIEAIQAHMSTHSA